MCNSAAPGGDYVTLMDNTHVLCVWLRYLQTLNRIVFPICTLYRSLSHGTSLEYKKWCMLWPTRWRGYLLSQQTCLAPSITSLWPFALLLWTGSATVACVWNQVSCCCCVCLIVCSTVAHILTNVMGNVSYSQVPQRWLQPTLWRHSCQSEHLTMFRRSHEIVRFNS